ncbi:MAG: hypothetical protein V4760_14380 [Bdellovibrionota bacterium]
MRILLAIIIGLANSYAPFATAAAEPVDVTVKLFQGRAEVSIGIKCEGAACSLIKSTANTRVTRAIVREDATYFLNEISKLPAAKIQGACGRRSMRIEGATKAPIEKCLDGKSTSKEPFFRLFRGLDASF